MEGKHETKTNKESRGKKDILFIVVAIFFILSGFLFISDYFIPSVLIILAGAILIPSISKKIENKLMKENFTYEKIKIGFIVLVFLVFCSSIGTSSEEVSTSSLPENTANYVSEKVSDAEQDEKINNTISEKDLKIKELENTINDTTSKVQELENTISDKDTKIKELEDNVNKLTTEKSSLESEVDDLKEEKETLEEKVSSLSTSTKKSTGSTTSQATRTSSTPTTGITNSYTVYITNTGSKYHSGGCSYLRQSKHAIDKNSAVSQGYTACSRCNP